jgi:tRNA-dihydrouridine synthase C
MLLLAPMEGLLDHRLREVLSQAGGFTRCVSEFIRITDQALPERVFQRIVPELLNGSRTRSGTPVRVQLLGSDPAWLAHNAAFVATMGAEGIDLNFGCPAPIVNRHRGGAVLLDEPELVHRIVAAVRRAVPAALPVSAKMRLGHRDTARMVDNALAIEAAGASELVVHARTKADGYRPPAYWGQVRHIRDAVRLPLVANGEIWTVADALRCRAESGCDALMLGRGQLADPGLAAAIQGAGPLPWTRVQTMLLQYWALLDHGIAPRHRAGRIKQWLNLLRRRYGPAQAAFDTIRRLENPAEVEAALRSNAVGEQAATSTSAAPRGADRALALEA